MPFAPQPRKRDADARRRARRSCWQPLSGVLGMARKVGATLIEKGVELWHDPAKAVALAEQGTRAHRARSRSSR